MSGLSGVALLPGRYHPFAEHFDQVMFADVTIIGTLARRTWPARSRSRCGSPVAETSSWLNSIRRSASSQTGSFAKALHCLREAGGGAIVHFDS